MWGRRPGICAEMTAVSGAGADYARLSRHLHERAGRRVETHQRLYSSREAAPSSGSAAGSFRSRKGYPRRAPRLGVAWTIRCWTATGRSSPPPHSRSTTSCICRARSRRAPRWTACGDHYAPRPRRTPSAPASTWSNCIAAMAICYRDSSRRSATSGPTRIWRLPGKPYAFSAGGLRRGAHALAKTQADIGSASPRPTGCRGGITPEDGLRVAAMFKAHGTDIIDVSAGDDLALGQSCLWPHVPDAVLGK